MMGLALSCLGRPEEAIASYAKGIRLDPRAPFLRANVCIAYTASGKYAKAEAACRECITLVPDSWIGYWQLVQLYTEQWNRQHERDNRILDSALEMASKCAALGERLCNSALGYVYLARKQHDLAVAAAEKMISSDPEDSRSYALLAYILNYTGAHGESIRMAERAMELGPNRMAERALLDPEYGFLMRILSHAYRLTGQPANALAAYEKFLDQNPYYIHFYATHRNLAILYAAHLELAILYSELDRIEEAEAEAQEVLKLVPHFSVEVYGQRVPYSDPAQAERDVAALRKAGLK